jgi:hypothetical protein
VKRVAALAPRTGSHRQTNAPDTVFELPPRRIERIANGDIDILVRMVQRPGIADEDVPGTLRSARVSATLDSPPVKH